MKEDHCRMKRIIVYPGESSLICGLTMEFHNCRSLNTEETIANCQQKGVTTASAEYTVSTTLKEETEKMAGTIKTNSLTKDSTLGVWDFST